VPDRSVTNLKDLWWGIDKNSLKSVDEEINVEMTIDKITLG
jgi:hypothetical protein